MYGHDPVTKSSMHEDYIVRDLDRDPLDEDMKNRLRRSNFDIK